MLARHGRGQRKYLLLPGIAVGIAYAAFCALPQYREIRGVWAESESQSAANDQLSLRVEALSENAERFGSEAGELTGPVDEAPAALHLVSAERSERTYIQAFAQVLAAFRSMQVDCTAAKSDLSGREYSAVAQRVSLTGSFANVLAAMEAIEAEIPHALAAELSMERIEATAPCRWEIAFQFSEGTE